MKKYAVIENGYITEVLNEKIENSVEFEFNESSSYIFKDGQVIEVAVNEEEIANTLKKFGHSSLNVQRTKEVQEIVVTLADGTTVLNGDEVAQGRIGRAILGLPDDTTTNTWVGANGDVYELTKPQFQEALQLAGEAQTAIWVKYATLKAEL